MESMGSGQGEIVVRTYLKHLSGDADAAAKGLEGDYVCLEVRDTGPGMSEETMSGIYDPYFRLMHPERGLGLLTVTGIAREHHGTVFVESEPNKGSCISICLPIAENTPATLPEIEDTVPVAAGGMILLVDDEPTIRSILSQGLERAGFKVIEAVDGVEGFGAFVRHRSAISAVLLDLTMPRMSGDQVLEEIRKLDDKVPVILMSGYSQQEATAALAGKGLSAFLSKPCTIKDALAVVRRVLGSESEKP
jgi:CheY-like chemotaxis protein